MFERVTDPEILKQLNSSNSEYEEVKDPAVLNKLNEGKKPYRPSGLLGGLIPPALHAGKVMAQDIYGAGKNVAHAIDPLTREVMQEPGRAAGNLASATTQAGTGTVNAPRSLPEYLAHLGFISPETANKIKPFMPTYTPNMPDTSGLVNKVLGTNQPEDKAVQEGLQSLLALSPLGKPLGKGVVLAAEKGIPAAGKLIKAPIAGTVNTVKDIMQTSKLPSEKSNFDYANDKFKELVQQEREAKQNAGMAISQAKATGQQSVAEAKLMGKQLIGETISGSKQEQLTAEQENANRLFEAKEAVAQKKSSAAQTEQELKSQANARMMAAQQAQTEAKNAAFIETGASSPEALQRKINAHESALTDLHNEIDNFPEIKEKAIPHEESEAMLNNAMDTHKKSTQLEQSTMDNIKSFLGSNRIHDEDLTQQLLPKVEKLQQDAKDAYSAFAKKVAETTSKMKPGALENYNKTKAEISKAAKGNDNLQQLLDIAPTDADVGVQPFIDKFKDLKQSVYHLGQMVKYAYQNPNISHSMLKVMREAHAKGKELQESAKTAVDNGLGTELKKEFEDVNKGYSEVLYPLEDNKIVQGMKEKGKITTGDIAATLRGTEEGNVILRNLIKSDPQSIKSVLGERFDKNPKNLFDPNVRTKEYLDLLPNLNEMIENHKSATEAANTSESHLKEATKQHQKNINLLEEKQKLAEKKESKLAEAKALSEKLETAKSHLDNLREVLKENPKGLSAEDKTYIESLKQEAQAAVNDAAKVAMENQQKLLDIKKRGQKKISAAEMEHLKAVEKVTKESMANYNKIKDEHLKILKDATEKKNMTLEEKMKSEKSYRDAQEAWGRTKTKLSLLGTVTGIRLLKHVIF